jgi:hypothetical protein
MIDRISEAQSRAQGDGGTNQSLATSLTQCFIELFGRDNAPLPDKIKPVSDTIRLMKDSRDFKAIEAAKTTPGKLDQPVLRHVFSLLRLAALTPCTSLLSSLNVL